MAEICHYPDCPNSKLFESGNHCLRPMERIFIDHMKCWVALVLLVLPLAVFADDEGELRAGHSSHGEAFNEGPRQAPYLMPGMPDIDFPITTASTEAQK